MKYKVKYYVQFPLSKSTQHEKTFVLLAIASTFNGKWCFLNVDGQVLDGEDEVLEDLHVAAGALISLHQT